VRRNSVLHRGGRLLSPFSWDNRRVLVWECDAGFIVNAWLPTPTKKNCESRANLDRDVAALLRRYGARLLAFIGDLTLTLTLNIKNKSNNIHALRRDYLYDFLSHLALTLTLAFIGDFHTMSPPYMSIYGYN
jgi:hypothetical protein